MYKVGDKVLLKTTYPTGSAINCVSEMVKYLGKVVTIHQVTTGYGTLCIRIEEDPGKYYWDVEAIEGIATDEFLEKIEREKKERMERIKYTPEQVGGIAKEIFGENRVDVIVEETNAFNIIIHFPELWVRNRNGTRHLVKDLYMKVWVHIGDIMAGFKANIGLRGLRTTFTVKEIDSNYSHSHLETGYMGSFAKFCVGSGSDISTLIENLRMDLLQEQWELLFLSLQPYLEWESIDTAPHIRMENISTRQETVSDAELNAELGRIIDMSPKEIWGWNAGNIELLSSHPSYRKWIDENSKIRSMQVNVSCSEEEAIKRGRRRLPKEEFVFKGKTVPYIVENDIRIEGDNSLEQDVLNAYEGIINNNSKDFSKHLEYERRKTLYGEIEKI